jgi:hypothetical protein
MNWEAIGVVAEVVAAAGVIITLVYVAIQIRQNTASTKTLTQQQLFDSVMEVNCRIADSSEIAGMMVKANLDYTTLESEEQIRLNYLFVNWFTLWHSAFIDQKGGLLDKSSWSIWNKGLTTVLSHEVAVRHAWSEFGHVYDDEFRSHVDEILKKIGPVSARGNGRMFSEAGE